MHTIALEKATLLEKLEKSNSMLSNILEDQENSLFTEENFKALNCYYWCRKSRKINFCKCVN